MKNKGVIYSFISFFLLSGCTVIPADKLEYAEASNVYVSNNKPADECHYVGEVYSKQGNWFTGMFTSNVDLSIGSRNNLKDQAFLSKANYVYLEALNINNGAFFIGGNKNVSIVGQAYYCQNMGKYKVNLVNGNLCGYFSFCLDSQ